MLSTSWVATNSLLRRLQLSASTVVVVVVVEELVSSASVTKDEHSSGISSRRIRGCNGCRSRIVCSSRW